MTALSIPLLGFLLLATAPAGQVFTVDDNGPADFAEILRAIDSPLVQDGDTLLVAKGSYEGFVLDKALHILPMAGKRYSVGPSVAVQGVASFSLVGADIEHALTVSDVPGRGLIDRCVVETTGWSSQYSFFIGSTHFTNCGELLVQRSHFRGSEACLDHGYTYADHAVEVENSTVVISDCVLLGGNEQGEGCRPPWMGGGPTSGSGLVVSAGSWVQVVDSTVLAGWAEYMTGAGLLPAIQVQDSIVDVRGNSSSLLKTRLPELTIGLDATSTVRVSGVTLEPPTLPAGVTSPAPAEPFLRVRRGIEPGGDLVLDLFGPAGAAGVLGLGAKPALLSPPLVAELLWLAPEGLFLQQVLVTAGQELPARLVLQLPLDPALTGFSLTAQAWVETGTSGPWLTNPIGVLLGG